MNRQAALKLINELYDAKEELDQIKQNRNKYSRDYAKRQRDERRMLVAAAKSLQILEESDKQAKKIAEEKLRHGWGNTSR